MAKLLVPPMPRNRSGSSMVLAIISIFFPAAILGALALMGKGAAPLFLRAGAGACVIVGLIAWRFVGTRPLGSALTGVPAAVGFVFLWLARLAPSDPVGHVALGLLILVPMSLFAGYALIATGAPSLRRAQRLTRRLASRKDLPLDIIACRQLPEMKELRESLRNEAAPALSLLVSDRPAVRLVALVALEYRRHWRVGEPNVILTIARSDPQPEVRAAAVLALAGVQQRLVLEEMAECLRDPAPIVRSSAVDAVLWDCERRWIWARHAVHEALADPRFQRDGALILSNGKFSDAAVNDLVAWATEAGILGQRATQTLARHYSQRLAEGADPLLVGRLSDHVADHRASAILRIELAHLLRQHMPVPRELLVKLLDPANPSPLRLLAVEQLLQAGPDQRAIDALREIAHQPNRELAIQAAVVVQRYLRVDLGLELGQPTPALHTRQAADVTRRVIQWATQQSKEQAASAPIAPPEPEPELEPPPAPLKPKSSVPLWDSLLSPPAATKPDTHLPPPEKFAPLEWD